MTNDELLELVSNKEQQLSRAESESDSWNKGKYKNSSNASVSKIYVSSLQKEIAGLRSQLTEINDL
jgi:hypothetical protein